MKNQQNNLKKRPKKINIRTLRQVIANFKNFSLETVLRLASEQSHPNLSGDYLKRVLSNFFSKRILWDIFFLCQKSSCWKGMYFLLSHVAYTARRCALSLEQFKNPVFLMLLISIPTVEVGRRQNSLRLKSRFWCMEIW